jgi:hypothetical protein
MPGTTSPSSDFAHLVDAAEAEGSTADPEFLSGTLPPEAWTGDGKGLLGMISESMFGNQRDAWQAMPLRTFFSEGWFEPWYYYPRSTTGAPRQAWINAYNYYFMAGIEVPLTGPKDQNFTYSPIFWLSKAW